jgi:hypothetical protein
MLCAQFMIGSKSYETPIQLCEWLSFKDGSLFFIGFLRYPCTSSTVGCTSKIYFCNFWKLKNPLIKSAYPDLIEQKE